MPPRAKTASRAKSATSASRPDPAAHLTLVFGPGDYFYAEAVDAVLAHARKHDPMTEKVLINGASTTAAAVAAALGADLFGAASVVCIEESESLDEPTQEAVLSAARELADGTRHDLRLILWHTNAVRARKFADALRESGAHEVAASKPKGYQLDGLLAEEFKRRKRAVDDDVPTALRLALGDDLAVLMNAVRALCEDVEHGHITVQHVALYQPGVADVPGWDVSDAVLGAQPTRALMLIRRALVADPNCGPALVAATASAMRQLVGYIPLRSAPEGQVASELGIPPFKIKTLAQQLRNWSLETLSRAVLMLADADVASKGQTLKGEGLEPEARTFEVERLLVGIASLPGH